MKTCFKCKEEKPLDSFYRHKSMADGHLNKCKDCTRQDVKARRRDPRYREKVLAYDRARGNRQNSEYVREYRDRYPKKYRAHSMVRYAVKTGKMRREDECSQCQSTNSVEAHHDDYNFPLSVRWLCASCHRQWHAEHGEAANGDL